MRMLALMTDAYGGYGGIAQYNRDFIEAAAEMDSIKSIDVAVRIAPLADGSPPSKARQHKPRHSRIQYALQSASLAAARRPQLVFSGHLYHGSLARMIAKVTGAKLVSQVHGTEVWGRIQPGHLAALNASDVVLCVSQHTRSQVLSKAPELHDRLVVLPNMVGPQFNPGDRSAARAKFGLRGEKVILTVGRLEASEGYKGHDRILQLLPSLRREFTPAVRYYIVGEGSDRGRLERMARELGVADQVVFLGRISHDDLLQVYRAANVFAMPSTGEGFGIVFLEAMACGTPAIGLDVGGAADSLAHGELGLCVSMDAFPSALRRALLDGEPDPIKLSNRVHSRFGRAAFKDRLEHTLRMSKGETFPCRADHLGFL
jgi:phosphatidylinositol alpha-1,6-mannosyltransferase